MFTVTKYRPREDGTYRKVTFPLIRRPWTVIADIRTGIARREEYDADMPRELQDRIITEWIGDSNEVNYKWWNRAKIGEDNDGVSIVGGSPEYIADILITHSASQDCRRGGIMLQRRSGEKAITLYGHIYPPYEEFQKAKNESSQS